MAAKRNIPEAWNSQWSKFMFNFFDYLPTKYEANKREWSIRRMIWDFKDGKRSASVAEDARAVRCGGLQRDVGLHTSQ